MRGPKALLVYLLCGCAAFTVMFAVYKYATTSNSTADDSSANQASDSATTKYEDAITILDAKSFPSPQSAAVLVTSPETSGIAAVAAIKNNMPLIVKPLTEVEEIEAQISTIGATEVVLVQPEDNNEVVLTSDSYDLTTVTVDCKASEVCANDDLSLLLAKDTVARKYKDLEQVDFTSLEAIASKRPQSSNTTVVALGERILEDSALESIAAAHASGYEVLLITDSLRFSSSLVETLREDPSKKIILVGTGYDSLTEVEAEVEAAKNMVMLPGGGQTILYTDDSDERKKRFVALYGSPQGEALGVLGEQNTEETIARAKELAAQYQKLEPETEVVPTLEIIVTVAAEKATEDNSYSIKTPIEVIQPLVDAAAEEGVYVVIDLQPGRQDFLTQAKIYEELLVLPHVGLALDPEWRLEPDERHLRQIGSVDADEINATGDWLAELVRENNLPQKMFLLHQFRLDMIPDRDKVDTAKPELEVVVQMDGQGSQSSKRETLAVLVEDAQEGLYFGWKNFYDEDIPQVLSPEKTLEIEPSPVFVSYQ